MSSHTGSLILIHLIEFVGLHSATLKQFGINHVAAANVGDKGLKSRQFAVVSHLVIVPPGTVTPLAVTQGKQHLI